MTTYKYYTCTPQGDNPKGRYTTWDYFWAGDLAKVETGSKQDAELSISQDWTPE